jgi:cyclopropane fatty-acyl-phospholipid synthase-like methyltransferase
MRWPIAVAAVALASLPASAQNSRFANKLAPFVTSSVKIVDRMLEMAHLKPGEKLYDLGCGDGRILITAAEKYKVKAVGVEISPKLVAEAERNIETAGLTDQASVIKGDLLQTDLSDADVVTIYLATSSNEKLRPRLERFLKPGARVISHDYAVPGWKPTQVERADDRHVHLIYLYEMPAAKVLYDLPAKSDGPARN